MSLRTKTIVFGVTCDKRGCEHSIVGEDKPFWAGRDDYLREAVAEGWTVWVSRGSRYYCPEHTPNPKPDRWGRMPKMRDVSDHWREGVSRG